MPGLDEVLRDMRDQHRQTPAPADLEGRLRAAVRSRHRMKRLAPVWVAAIAAGIALLVWFAPPRRERPPDAAFLALPSSAGLPEPSATTVLRMQLRRVDLPQYGLSSDLQPIREEFVSVDFVVGEDGLARSARVVAP